MNNTFLDFIQNRRTIYGLSNSAPVPDSQIQGIIETAVRHTPSAFNSQTARVVLLLGNEHLKFWNEVVLGALQKIVPVDHFAPTEAKIKSFADGYGTILFFEEQTTVHELQEKFPMYADNFPVWSLESSGMLQFVIWTALENEGFGASLQHYNPIIDEQVLASWNLSRTWKLLAQMPFGKPTTPADPNKSYLPIETRVKVFK